ncbi:hypothetical protein RSAG8_07901, partial [Rhizoctonia solani AG-8 WAC10335]
MTDSDEEPSLKPRRSSRPRSPSKNSGQYREERLRADIRRKESDRKQVVKDKRAAANGPSTKPRLSIIPEIPAASSSTISTRSVSAPNHGDPKGKAREPTTPAATLGRGRRLITPNAEGDMDWEDVPYPGPRPQPTGDSIDDGVLEEEWKRQLLLWYLARRDRKPIPPTSDYDDLKHILQVDPLWDSEDETLSDRLYHMEYPEEMGFYDREPIARRPVQVRALDAPVQPEASTSQGKKIMKAQTATNLFKRKATDGPNEHEKRPRRSTEETSTKTIGGLRQRAGGLVLQGETSGISNTQRGGQPALVTATGSQGLVNTVQPSASSRDSRAASLGPNSSLMASSLQPPSLMASSLQPPRLAAAGYHGNSRSIIPKPVIGASSGSLGTVRGNSQAPIPSNYLQAGSRAPSVVRETLAGPSSYRASSQTSHITRTGSQAPAPRRNLHGPPVGLGSYQGGSQVPNPGFIRDPLPGSGPYRASSQAPYTGNDIRMGSPAPVSFPNPLQSSREAPPDLSSFRTGSQALNPDHRARAGSQVPGPSRDTAEGSGSYIAGSQVPNGGIHVRAGSRAPVPRHSSHAATVGSSTFRAGSQAPNGPRIARSQSQVPAPNHNFPQRPAVVGSRRSASLAPVSSNSHRTNPDQPQHSVSNGQPVRQQGAGEGRFREQQLPPRGPQISANQTSTRGQSEDELEDELDELEDDQDEGGTQRESKSSSRGRLNQFVGVQKKILKWAGRAFYAIMATQGMYETDIDIIDQRRLEAWNLGCEKYGVTTEDYPFAQAHVENLNDRLCTARTHAKEAIEPAVNGTFFMEQLTPDELKAHIERLKESGLHTKPNSQSGKGYFQHPILQECLNKIFFSHEYDIGIQFIDLFRMPSKELMCYFCALIEFCIEKHEPGVSRKQRLSFDAQRTAYFTHMDSHAVFLARSEGRWVLTQQQLFLRAFHNSGSGQSALSDNTKSALRNEEIQPDVPDEDELAAWEAERAEMDIDGGEPGEWPDADNENYAVQDEGQEPIEPAGEGAGEGEGEGEYLG